ncbi:MAG: lipase family protein [Candidatus Binatia bacterium]
MRNLGYTASRENLYHPEMGPTIFKAGDRPSDELLCAEASRLAYKKFERDPASKAEIVDALARVGYAQVEFFSDNGTQAFAAADSHSSVLLAFRGTEQSPMDVAADLETLPVPWTAGGRVHAGFARALSHVWRQIEAWLQSHPDRWLYTGHSLGAALATLAASLRKPAKLIVFGSPLVGDGDFRKTLAGVAIDRYVDCCDLVCRIPPEELGFRHVASPAYIDRVGNIKTGVSAAEMIADQIEARAEYWVKHAGKIGNIKNRDLADHAPLNYVSALYR